MAEISHELGNYLHKLYYCADAVQDASSAGPADRSPAVVLADTLRSFEGFLRSAFAHFSPVEVNVVPMSVREIASAVAQRLELPAAARPRSHDPGAADLDRIVRVDPGLLSQVVAILGERLDARTAGARVACRLGISQDAAGMVTFCVSVESPNGLRPHGIESALRWAKAQQLVALHGGALRESNDNARYRVTMSLRQ